MDAQAKSLVSIYTETPHLDPNCNGPWRLIEHVGDSPRNIFATGSLKDVLLAVCQPGNRYSVMQYVQAPLPAQRVTISLCSCEEAPLGVNRTVVQDYLQANGITVTYGEENLLTFTKP